MKDLNEWQPDFKTDEDLKEEITKLESVVSGYEDTINERDRENTSLQAQLALVGEFTKGEPCRCEDEPLDCVRCYHCCVDTILTTEPKVLAVVDGQIRLVTSGADDDWFPELCVNLPAHEFTGDQTVTVIMLASEGGTE